MPAPARRTPIERWTRSARYLFLRFVRFRSDPVHVARGFALGIFLGIFPTFGIGIIGALLIASLLRWNLAAAALGALVMNRVTGPFFWNLSAAVGAFMFRVGMQDLMNAVPGGERFRAVSEEVLIYMAGNLVVSLVTAGAGYAGAVRLLRFFRRKKHEAWERRRALRPGAGD